MAREQKIKSSKPIIKTYLVATMIGIIASIACVCVFSYAITAGMIPQKIALYLTAISAGVGALCCGFISAAIIRKNGAVNGFLNALIMFLCLFITGAVASKALVFDKNVMIMLSTCVVFGTIGGIMAVSFRRSGRRIKSKK